MARRTAVLLLCEQGYCTISTVTSNSAVTDRDNLTCVECQPCNCWVTARATFLVWTVPKRAKPTEHVFCLIGGATTFCKSKRHHRAHSSVNVWQFWPTANTGRLWITPLTITPHSASQNVPTALGQIPANATFVTVADICLELGTVREARWSSMKIMKWTCWMEPGRRKSVRWTAANLTV